MEETTLKLMQSLPDTHLGLFATRLREWLITDLNKSDEPVPEFTESRAKALLRAANVIDDPFDRGVHAFGRQHQYTAHQQHAAFGRTERQHKGQHGKGRVGHDPLHQRRFVPPDMNETGPRPERTRSSRSGRAETIPPDVVESARIGTV